MKHKLYNRRFLSGITIALLALLLFPASPRLFAPAVIFSPMEARAAKPGKIEIWPMPDWPLATPAEQGMDAAKLAQAREYALKGGGSGFITRGGKLVFSWEA